MRNVRPLLSTAFVLASSMLLAACPLLSSATTTSAQTDPVALAVVQGNGQIAQAGRAVASPVVLRVLDANGRGVRAGRELPCLDESRRASRRSGRLSVNPPEIRAWIVSPTGPDDC